MVPSGNNNEKDVKEGYRCSRGLEKKGPVSRGYTYPGLGKGVECEGVTLVRTRGGEDEKGHPCPG